MKSNTLENSKNFYINVFSIDLSMLGYLSNHIQRRSRTLFKNSQFVYNNVGRVRELVDHLGTVLSGSFSRKRACRGWASPGPGGDKYPGIRHRSRLLEDLWRSQRFGRRSRKKRAIAYTYAYTCVVPLRALDSYGIIVRNRWEGRGRSTIFLLPLPS